MRSDIVRLRKRVDEGERLSLIIKDCPSYNVMRMIEKLFSYKAPSTVFLKKEVLWFWGLTGKGKTKRAYDIVKAKEDPTSFWIATDHQWFDGFDGQEVAIIDELRAKDWPYSLMLRLLDGYELRIPVKGGFRIWNPKMIIITTPFLPETTYVGTMEYVDGGIDQLLRRITRIREFI